MTASTATRRATPRQTGSPGPRPVVPAALLAVATDQCGLVSRAQAYRTGMTKDSVRRRLRTGMWTEPTRDVFLILPELRHPSEWSNRMRQRALLAPLAGGERSVTIGIAALVLAGVQGAPRSFVPEYVLPAGRQHASRPIVRQRRLTPRADRDGWPPRLQVVRGVTCANPVWALAQSLPAVPSIVGMRLLDSALHTKAITEEDLTILTEMLERTSTGRRITQWFPLVDGRAESPLETDVRMECYRDGVSPDDLQTVVLTGDERFVARCDLTWQLSPGRLLIVEADGAHHRDQVRKDYVRDNDLTALGHVVFHYSSDALGTGEITATVRTELAKAGVAPRGSQPTRPSLRRAMGHRTV